MALWTTKDICAAVGAASIGDCDITGISIDTRTLQAGDLFVALTDQRDGHDFVATALENGAAAALVSYRPAGVLDDAPLVLVPDVLQALNDLGAAARARTGARILAVTGSVGKTSTKEMLRVILQQQGKTHASVASYNNHWGVPLTLARMPADTEYGIFEIGMNHPGEIAPLSKLVRPHAAMITTIAPAHLQAFSGLDGIAHEKSEIVAGLCAGGAAILPADAPHADILVQRALQQNAVMVGFGQKAEAYRLTATQIHGDVMIVQGSLRGQPMAFRLNTLGRHFAQNAMGALAAVEALGGDPTRAAMDLPRWHPPAGRGQREEVKWAGGVLHLIDDAYNANPASMQAALEVLSNLDAGAGRRVAILGDMLELGAGENALHAALAQGGEMQGIDTVHCIGTRMKALHDALPENQRGLWYASAADFLPHLPKQFHAGDVVLIKGSFGSKVSQIVDAMRKLGHR